MSENNRKHDLKRLLRKQFYRIYDIILNSEILFMIDRDVVQWQVGCYTRSTPTSYKLLSEYNLLLTQRLTSYPLVLVGLYCGSSSFARVTNELPLVVLWLFCVAGT
jgi:hypothetical protein